MTNTRLDALTDEEWEAFLPLCPDFVLEFRSKNDRLPTLRAKMEEYQGNGARLGWLVDPKNDRSQSITMTAALNNLIE